MKVIPMKLISQYTKYLSKANMDIVVPYEDWLKIKDLIKGED